MFNGVAVWKLNLTESTEQKLIGSSIPLICIRNGGEWSHDCYLQLEWGN